MARKDRRKQHDYFEKRTMRFATGAAAQARAATLRIEDHVGWAEVQPDGEKGFLVSYGVARW
ncbi:MAG: hypothetical protein ABIO70_21410 [Pseudomonadota bacterium]